MAKFNLSSLLSSASLNNEKKEIEEERDLKKIVYKITPISVYDLIPSKDNFYSMEQIEDLKTAIELAGGIKQNLTVAPLSDGKYKVLAGHRRRLASIKLVEEGKTEYELLPCSIEIVEEDKELQEIREELLLILTNSQRNKTDWDKVEEVRRLRLILERYKKKEKIPGRIREIIAETLNTSAAQVGRMDSISKNLSQEFKEELKAEKLNISTAYELSGLTEEKQGEAFKEYQEKGSFSIKDAKQKKEEVEIKEEENAAHKLDKLNKEINKNLAKEYEEIEAKYKELEKRATFQFKEEISEKKGIVPDIEEKRNILSDISKRILVVKGVEEVRSIETCNNRRDVIKVKNLYDDIWQVELIKRIGSYYEK